MNTTTSLEQTPPPRDLLALSKAPMGELLAALEDDETLADEGGAAPPMALQVASLISAEAVRLIRLGTRSELADAALEIAETLTGEKGKLLAERHPEAHRLVSGASVTLGAATAPSSSGGEMAVLRSWSGNARRAVERINGLPDQAIQRSDLRELLGVDESYLSHLLADLEAAGLIVRTRRGRTVTVHLGPIARSDHVQEVLGDSSREQAEAFKRHVRNRFQAALDCWLAPERRVENAVAEEWTELRRQVVEIQQELHNLEGTVEEVYADGGAVVCGIRVSGRRGHGKNARCEERRLAWIAHMEGGEITSAEPLASVGSGAPLYNWEPVTAFGEAAMQRHGRNMLWLGEQEAGSSWSIYGTLVDQSVEIQSEEPARDRPARLVHAISESDVVTEPGRHPRIVLRPSPPGH